MNDENKDDAEDLGDFDAVADAMAAMGIADITKIRLMGMAEDEIELRRISCALAFVGYGADLRVGVAPSGWGWRTPLLSPSELFRFVELTEVVPVAFSPSNTTPEHGNIMVMRVGQIEGFIEHD